METQRFSVRGRTFDEDDPALQVALGGIYETSERPRCLCMPGGVEMYVAFHRRYIVKRMPDTGCHHHAQCPSFEPELHQSGLGELIGDAVLESATGAFELRVDFPWNRHAGGRWASAGPTDDPGEVEGARRRLSLRALAHFLFERAGFNRWSPAMSGKRTQGTLHKYLLRAAEDVSAKGVALAERLYVPEPFSETTHAEVSRRRRERLAFLHPEVDRTPLAIVMAEFKGVEERVGGYRVWLKHMPDAPLLTDQSTWQRIARVFAAQLEARDADHGLHSRLMMVALIRARRAFTYEVDTAALLLMSEQWIPVEDVHELPLLQALVDAQRRFIKPLRYDARCAGAFAEALLLDAGAAAVPLHVVTPFMSARERAAKAAAIRAAPDPWVWRFGETMPALPAVIRRP